MTNENTTATEIVELSKLWREKFLSIGAYTIDVQKRILTINGISKKITTKETDLMLLFAGNQGTILDRRFVLRAVWEDETYNSARSMDVYICKIRKLLKDDPSIIIINIHGKGYQLFIHKAQ